jgi:hypothetical protein
MRLRRTKGPVKAAPWPWEVFHASGYHYLTCGDPTCRYFFRLTDPPVSVVSIEDLQSRIFEDVQAVMSNLANERGSGQGPDRNAIYRARDLICNNIEGRLGCYGR